MAQFETRNEGAVSSEFLRTSQVAVPHIATKSGVPDVIAELSEQTLLPNEAAQFVFRAQRGSVLVLGGIDGATLRELLEHAEQIPDDRRALFVRLQPAASVEAYVEQAITLLAETALRLWPVWFTDVSFAMCGSDALGQTAAGVIAREAASRAPGVSAAWAELAARLVLEDRAPRVDCVLPATELAQLSLAISRQGLILVLDVGAAATAGNTNAAALGACVGVDRPAFTCGRGRSLSGTPAARLAVRPHSL